MVKIVFFSDTHLGIDMPLRPKKNRRRRGPDYFKNFELVLEHAVKQKADLIIHGGDLFDTANIHQNIVDLAYEKLFNTADKGIPIVICPGNHERSVLPSSLYLQHQNIFTFKETQVFSFIFNNLKIEIAGFPYFRRYIKNEFPNICKYLSTFHNNKHALKFLLMHQAIEGAVVGPQKFMFRSSNDVVQIKDIPAHYDLILSGHIHPTQQLKTKHSKPILFAGSTERTAFAEKDEKKGFYEINIREDKSFSLDFMPLNTRPMEIIRLELDKYTDESIKAELLAKINVLPKDAVVQIRLANSDNLSLLKVKLLDDIFPKTMNYQISGIRNIRSK